MTSGMPELGSKISLISKADIRYEGRLFTVDPQECTIALAKVQSFGTEDRETQYPVAPQSQVYEYILFRGADIKDIRVVNNPTMPNDPAIVQMSVPPSMSVGGATNHFSGPFSHPVVNQTQYPQYHPMAGFPGGVHAPLNKASELSLQPTVDLPSQPLPVTAPIGSGVVHHINQVKDQGSMLDLIGGGSQQNASRSGTPNQRKSPTVEQGTQVGSTAGGSQRRGSGSGPQKQGQPRGNRPNSRTRQRYPSGGQPPHQQSGQPHYQSGQPHHQLALQQHHYQPGQGYNHNRGGWRGRPRGRGRGGFIPRNKNTLKFDNDYDFEQANTEFEELRNQLAKTKISDGDAKPEGEVDKKDDSGNETGAGEAEQDEEANGFSGYDKNKSFFDNISCEAVERSKGRSQRTDWRTERKLNSETFGVASARRGAWRGRGAWRHHNTMHQPWRPMRGGRGRGNGTGRPRNNSGPNVPSTSATTPPAQPQPATAAAK